MEKDTSINPTIWIVNLSAALVVVGVLVLLYGTVMTTPVLYGALLSLQANLLGSVTDVSTPIQELRPATVLLSSLPRIPQSVFLVACLLIVEGACLDVCRRLRILHQH